MDCGSVCVVGSSSSLGLLGGVQELILEDFVQELKVDVNVLSVAHTDDIIQEQKEVPHEATPMVVSEETTLLAETISHSVSATNNIATVVESITMTEAEVVNETPTPSPVAIPSSSSPSKKDSGNTNNKWKEIESVFSPPIDIVERKDSYHIYAEVPGMNLKDISVDLSNNMFTLEGYKQDHRIFSARSSKEGADVIVRTEINKGRFKRVLELPDNVDTDKVNVSFEEGMLQFKIRKVAEREEDGAEADNSEQDNSDQGVEDDESKENEKTETETEKETEEKQEEKVVEENNDGAVEVNNIGTVEVNIVEGEKKHRRPKKKLNKKRSSCLVQ